MARILMVDDDRSLTHLIKTVLVDEGYEVAIADTAVQAMEEIKDKKPDLILMDVVMPKIGGPEAVRTLQKDNQLKHIPVIFLTGLISNFEEDLEKKGIVVHGKNYRTIGKPFKISHLLNVIKESLAN